MQDALTEVDTVPVLFDQIFAALLATSGGQSFNHHLSRWGNLVATIASFWSGSACTVHVKVTLQALVAADLQLDQIRSWRCYRALSRAVDRLLSQEAELIPDEELPQCVEAVEATGNARKLHIFRALQDRKCFECPVCRSWVGNSLQLRCSMPGLFSSGHVFCRDCLRTWASMPEQLQSMISRRSFTLPCFCCVDNERPRGTILAQDLSTCGRCQCTVRPCSCSSLAKLCRDLDFRDRILKSAGFLRRFWGYVLDCPQVGCVGLACADTGVAMCFMCEHQWEPQASYLRFFFRLASHLWKGLLPDLPEGCKRCPTCQVPIEKDGGCDHMTCRCGHEFYWSSLRRYRR